MVDLEMEVVDIRKINGDSKLKAYADLKIANCFIAKGFSVMKSNHGFDVLMPRKPWKDKWFEVLTPLNEEVKNQIEDLVLEAFDKETDGVAK